MISYYDTTARQILENNKPPRGYTVDVIEKDTEPSMVYLRVYAIEIHMQSDHRAEELAAWLKRILDQLNNSLSIGKFTYEISTNNPGDNRE